MCPSSACLSMHTLAIQSTSVNRHDMPTSSHRQCIISLNLFPDSESSVVHFLFKCSFILVPCIVFSCIHLIPVVCGRRLILLTQLCLFLASLPIQCHASLILTGFLQSSLQVHTSHFSHSQWTVDAPHPTFSRYKYILWYTQPPSSTTSSPQTSLPSHSHSQPAQRSPHPPDFHSARPSSGSPSP